MTRILKDGFQGQVMVPRQIGLHDVRRFPVPCLIGVTLDVDALVERLGRKALRSKGKRATAFYGALVLEVRELTALDAPTPAGGA